MNKSIDLSIQSQAREIILAILEIYKSAGSWNERQSKSRDILINFKESTSDQIDFTILIKAAIRNLLPKLTTDVSDSDTFRFFREAVLHVFSVDIIDSNEHCRICTYPDGFLDTYLDDDGICSACRTYANNKSILENHEYLENILQQAINQSKSDNNEFDAIVSFSGGKDSVFVLKQLIEKYHARVLCVLDDLNQQTETAMMNASNAIKEFDIKLHIIEPPEEEREIRRNFLLKGENFCRLCLRSHFARVYNVAVEKQVPYVFLGLTPYQILDCPNAIEWSMNAIHDLSTAPQERDSEDILNRYKHRFIQGGYDRGFVSENEIALLSKWKSNFKLCNNKCLPLLLPFYLFEEYPGDEKVIEIISNNNHWIKPDQYIYQRSNCRWQHPAGIVHRAIFQMHMNYKEFATALRLEGKIMTSDEAKELYQTLNHINENEKMNKIEFESILQKDFQLTLDELPVHFKKNLIGILEND